MTGSHAHCPISPQFHAIFSVQIAPCSECALPSKSYFEAAQTRPWACLDLLFAACPTIFFLHTNHKKSRAMDGSLIGRLPAELRNQIYHELVPEPTTMDIDLSQPKKRAESLPGQPQDALLALASTCKAIRREAMKIYYHGRVWHVNVNLFYASAGSIVVCPPTLRPRGFAELRSWLDDMGKDGMGNISDLHIFVKGKLGFLAWRDINRRNIESATNRLTDALREVKDVMHATATMTVQPQDPTETPWPG